MNDEHRGGWKPHNQKSRRVWIWCCATICLLFCRPLCAQPNDQRPDPRAFSATETDRSTDAMLLPDVVLLDQDSRPRHFYTDLVKDKIVAINFIFTACETLCPMSGANFGELQQLLSDRIGKDVFLISISVDPEGDTPQGLKVWSKRFNAGPNWTLLTGSKQDVDAILKALKVFKANKESHSAVALLGNDAAGKWIRVSGLTAPGKLFELISALSDNSIKTPVIEPDNNDQISEKQPGPAHSQHEDFSAARRYFPDVTLINQEGQKMQVYSDLLKDKVAVISSFAGNRPESCPVTRAMLTRIQDWLGDRLGKQVNLISVSAAPDKDTPDRIEAFARQFKTKPGSYFLGGEVNNVNLTLTKLGQFGKRTGHTNSLIFGNDRTGLWLKAIGLANAEDVIKVLEVVLNDGMPGTGYPGKQDSVFTTEIKAVCAD
jgi:protein SCO1